MITVRNLRKVYGSKVAVDNLSFDVRPGSVTGFLGPNGAGKSTTMRLMLGLDEGDGETLFDGRPFFDIEQPMRHVGAVLDAKSVHPKRTARNHLRMLAAASGIPSSRADEVLAEVGLESVADKQPGGFSLGMGQRLGLAGALLGRPRHLILDEPGNGLDPQGIHWLRDFLKSYAQADRTVFVSSHLLSEMNLMADRLVVIGKGRTLHFGDVASFVNKFSSTSIVLRSSRLAELVGLLRTHGARDTPSGDGAAVVTGIDASTIGEVAAQHGIVVHELTVNSASLEDAFLHATGNETEFTKTGTAAAARITPHSSPSVPVPSSPPTVATAVPGAAATGTAAESLGAHVQGATPPAEVNPQTAANAAAWAAQQGQAQQGQAAPGQIAQGQAAAGQMQSPLGASQPVNPAVPTASAAAGAPQTQSEAKLPVAKEQEEALQREARLREMALRGEEPSPWQEPVSMQTLGYRPGADLDAPVSETDSAESPLFVDTSHSTTPPAPPRRQQFPEGRSRYDYDYGATAAFYPPGPSPEPRADANQRTVGWDGHDNSGETWLTSSTGSHRGQHAAANNPEPVKHTTQDGHVNHIEWDLHETTPRHTPKPATAAGPVDAPLHSTGRAVPAKAAPAVEPMRYQPMEQAQDPRYWLDPSSPPPTATRAAHAAQNVARNTEQSPRRAARSDAPDSRKTRRQLREEARRRQAQQADPGDRR